MENKLACMFFRPEPDWEFMEHREAKVYQNGRQYTSKDELWQEIVVVCRAFTPEEFQKLTSSMDKRIWQIISKKGAYLPNY